MDVTIYTTPTCPHCQTAKRFLAQRGVAFRENDVSRNRAAAQEMVRRSGQQGVPVIVVDDEVIVGFDRPRLEAALARARHPRPSLGVRVAAAEVIARQERRQLPAGALVGHVAPGSPAERAGLRRGDVILAVDGVAVRGPDDLQRVLAGLSQGRSVSIAWWRKGQQLQGTLDL